MSAGVVVIDRGIPDGPVAPWLDPNTPIGLASPRQGPEVLTWSRAWSNGAGLTDLIVLSRPRDGRQARGIATLVAGSRPGVAATALVRHANPLGLAAAAHVALSETRSGSVAHRLIDEIISLSVSGARLARVTGLEDPQPSIWQHLSSILGRAKTVTFGPTPAVLPAGHTFATGPGSTLLMGAGLETPEAVAVRARIEAEHVYAVPPVVECADAYGSRGIEFVLLSQRSAQPTPWGTCRICRTEIVGHVCPMCRVRSSRAESAA
ncbi:MAG: hypothetical protein JNL54_13795 [Kineosporiaceae bacterium]|nr:hypothetical protein [Kineosporiaceae bacterium]